jgi:NADH dehydrogenase [ubiquinone] 1 alpha subcomplex assembly factor 7
MSVNQEINTKIKNQGFITIDEFMQIAMSGLGSSYYQSKQPLGESGDFITAPEISQIFGEMVAIWCIDIWQKLGKPSKFNLLEYGAGRGVLMRDLLRMAKTDNEFYNALDIWIIDINPRLIEIQKTILSKFEDKKIQWIDKIQEVSKYPTIILANEFFDALPIKQYEKQNGSWKERILRMNEEKKSLEFAFRNIESISDRTLSIEHPNALEGSIYEESPQSVKIMEEISHHIETNKGAALIIDYGYDIELKSRTKNQYNSTLQALKNHKYTDILASPGKADLSAHVDFSALKKIASGLHVFGAISQRELLKNCGIDIRLNSLVKSNPKLASLLQAQYNRLMDVDKMGELFKAIAVFSEKDVPLGF